MTEGGVMFVSDDETGGKRSDVSAFRCRRCGACCRIEGFVRLTDADVGAMAAHLGVGEDDFIGRFADIAADRRSLVLKDRADGACVMLGDDNRCRVYPVRPKMCRTFPYEWINVNSYGYCPGLAGCVRG